jgi:cell division septal protein FtsQ
MAQTATSPSAKRSRTTGTPRQSRKGAPGANSTSDQRANRRRSVQRHMRRFETALAGVNFTARLAVPRRALAWLTGTGWHPSKLLSGLLCMLAITFMSLIHVEDEWYVYAEDMHFENLTYLQPAELYELSDVDGWNIFWLEPKLIRQRLLEHTYVTDAQVRVGLPTQIQVTVQEIQPVALWVTNQGTFWLAADGSALAAQGELDPTLPQIIDSLLEAHALSSNNRMAVDPQILNSALELLAKLPELNNSVRFNRGIGLNFPLPEHSVWVYWGDGFHLQAKLNNLTAARQMLRQDPDAGTIVDVRYERRPYLH